MGRSLAVFHDAAFAAQNPRGQIENRQTASG